MRISRADRSRLTDWWFSVDRALFAAVLVLMGASLVLSFAASPAMAVKKGLHAYYFVERQFLFSLAGAAVMFAVSVFSPQGVRRLAAALFFASLAGLAAVLVTGAEINGARRWLSLGGLSFQPSETLKPAFVVLTAWLLAEARLRPKMPAMLLATGGLLVVTALLAAQPDIGQTLLVGTLWGGLFFLSGQPVLRAAPLVLAGAGGLALAYATIDHVRIRFDRYFDPAPGDTSQVDRAMQSFAQGGFLGRGPGEGTIKSVLPDAHSDFIFAVIAEEYGVLACLVLLGLFAFVVLRLFGRGRAEQDPANRLAIFGLALLFGLQTLINMGVNVGLLPAKGITLPFISAGGSSIIGMSITLGMALALARRRADPDSVELPEWTPIVEDPPEMRHAK